MKVKIGNRLIGDAEPCFIIAEAGVNHNGDINLAKKLIDAAKAAGETDRRGESCRSRCC
jgi:sialic acid synthase SpsE